jgi:GNAT superfamily N-acetyltransferase
MTETDCRIDAAAITDADGVTSLLEASYAELMRPAYPPADLARALPRMTVANPFLLESGRFFVARDPGGGIAGCGGWSLAWPGTQDGEPNLGHLRHFATHPAWTRHGIGRRIAKACFAQAAEAGVVAFEVQSALNAVDFYASLGFRTVALIPIDFGDGVVLECARMRLAG